MKSRSGSGDSDETGFAISRVLAEKPETRCGPRKALRGGGKPFSTRRP